MKSYQKSLKSDLNLEIRRKIPKIPEIQREIPGIWPETNQIQPEIP